MTRKDYVKLVDVIKDYTVFNLSKDKNYDNTPLVNIFCGVLSSDNHRFNRDKFRDAVNKAVKNVTCSNVIICLPPPRNTVASQ